MKYSLVLLAAGSGRRTGLSYNKMFYKIDGETVVEKALHNFIEDEDCTQIILVAANNEIDHLKNILKNEKIEYVLGGVERKDSVCNGLALVNNDFVLIHDGARCFVDKIIIENVKNGLLKERACVPMIPVTDTIKIINDGYIEKTLDRNTLMSAQTPQGFQTELIKMAHDKAKNCEYMFTDDASMVECFQLCKVKIVDGSYENIKITTSKDLH